MTHDTKYTMDDLFAMRGWTLQKKIQVTQTRLLEWYMQFDGRIYISFSGGKDSTVLADLAARVYKAASFAGKAGEPLTLVFVNTGLACPSD